MFWTIVIGITARMWQLAIPTEAFQPGNCLPPLHWPPSRGGLLPPKRTGWVPTPLGRHLQSTKSATQERILQDSAGRVPATWGQLRCGPACAPDQTGPGGRGGLISGGSGLECGLFF